MTSPHVIRIELNEGAAWTIVAVAVCALFAVVAIAV